jgi:hypothetical protein
VPDYFKSVSMTALPALFLAAPSFWLLSRVPPLWRDVDAYVQTVYPPGALTILLHAPLYCALSRIPLWFGYLISRAGPLVGFGHFIKHTQLTDAGVFVLLFLQHAGLWCAAFYLICGIATTLAARLFLSILFASQPLFYTFAHCVGSETLSMIALLFLVGSGVRIALSYPDIGERDLIIFTALLCCCILTRHINCVLAALLPLTFILVLLERRLRIFAWHRSSTPADNFNLAKAKHAWLVSVALGLIALLLATTLTHLLCWRAHTRWRSTFGYTFIWRLNFLEGIARAPRQELLNATASKCNLSQSHELLAVLDAWMDRNKPWDPQGFIREAHANLSDPEMKFHGEKFDRVLNEIAQAFVYPPNAALQSAAVDDFIMATRYRESDVAQSLFLTTDYVFAHLEVMPQCSRLETFRWPRDRLFNARMLFYFQWWNLFSLRAWGVLVFALLLLAFVVDYRRGCANAPVILFAGSLSILGMVMVLLNCLFAQLQPRFVLPMMEFLFSSFLILLGVILRGSNCRSGMEIAPR